MDWISGLFWVGYGSGSGISIIYWMNRILSWIEILVWVVGRYFSICHIVRYLTQPIHPIYPIPCTYSTMVLHPSEMPFFIRHNYWIQDWSPIFEMAMLSIIFINNIHLNNLWKFIQLLFQKEKEVYWLLVIILSVQITLNFFELLRGS